MRKVNTIEERNLNRTRRLRKKLSVGEFAENLHRLTAKLILPLDTTDEEALDKVFWIDDLLFESAVSMGGYMGTVGATKCLKTTDFKVYNIDACLCVSAKNSIEPIIEWAKGLSDHLKDIKITEGKDSVYDPVWDEEDSFDESFWKVIYSDSLA